MGVAAGDMPCAVRTFLSVTFRTSPATVDSPSSRTGRVPVNAGAASGVVTYWASAGRRGRAGASSPPLLHAPVRRAAAARVPVAERGRDTVSPGGVSPR
ncbi:hypothetical protein DMB38_21685 [Streptomyces sp. WAC 06738]|nr:hypothetical protein DMB38_21685 [Streptomyces sp. WAC 06738]